MTENERDELRSRCEAEMGTPVGWIPILLVVIP